MKGFARSALAAVAAGCVLLCVSCAQVERITGGITDRIRGRIGSGEAQECAADGSDILFCMSLIKPPAENAVRENDWRLLLVNPWNRIPEGYEVKTAEVENGYEVDDRALDSLKAMLADCREAGCSPRIISTFRTRETQQYLYDHTANKADTAVPGTSEHECGLAADIIDSDSLGWPDPLIDKQEDMPAQKWLMENCRNYGFILRYPKDKEDITGIIYEPWHYRYVGEAYAKEIMERGVCLEEYLGRESDSGRERITI